MNSLNKLLSVLRTQGAQVVLAKIVGRAANLCNLMWIAPRWISRGVYLGARPSVGGIANIELGRKFFVRSDLWLDAIHAFGGAVFTPRIVIGKNFSASRMIHIAAIGSVTIGEDCLFGSNVLVTDHNHGDLHEQQHPPFRPPIANPLHSNGPVSIGDRVWLGDNVVVLGGATIGNDVIVGANSVVTGALPAGYICVGAPCKPIRKR
jgi:acetyltransferase-like isoleucine patch superfamily enzyme